MICRGVIVVAPDNDHFSLIQERCANQADNTMLLFLSQNAMEQSGSCSKTALTDSM